MDNYSKYHRPYFSVKKDQNKTAHTNSTSQTALQGNVGMFFPGIALLLAGQHLQVSADPFPGGRGLNDVIDKA